MSYKFIQNSKVEVEENIVKKAVSLALSSEEELSLPDGTKVVVTGRLQTGSYKNKDGVTVYTTDVIAEEQEFAESKNAQSGGTAAGEQTQQTPPPAPVGADGFMNIPDGIDEELPFN